MVQIFSTGQAFGDAGTDMAGLRGQVAAWEACDGLDMVLVGYSAMWPQNLVTASVMFTLTKRLGLIVAHRPGVMHPAIAARIFGTMDLVAGPGRLAINLVSGSSEKDLHREGDYLPKTERYDRAAEYVETMKRCWSESGSFDHEGKYYKADSIRQLLRPATGQIPIYMGGESDDAIEFGAKHADVYMLWGEPLAGTRERIERVRTAAAQYGTSPQFSLSMRLFLGDTDEEAWHAARAVEKTILDAEGTNRFMRSAATDASVGRDRQLATAEHERHDECFWTGLVKLLGGFANSAALVGTPDRVMESLRRYRELGIDRFLITTGMHGYWDPSLNEFCLRMKNEL